MSGSSRPPVGLMVRLFGAFDVASDRDLDGLRTKKTKTLVALLSLRPGTLFPREQIAADLWPESTATSARQSLRMALANIRSVFGADTVLVEQEKIGLNPDFVTSDAAEFERLCSLGRFQDALDLVRGAFAIDLEHPWLTAEGYRIHEAVAQAAVQLASEAADTLVRQAAITSLKRILSATGCREDLHIALMQLYLAEGLPSLAIAQFEILENDLADLWGEPPSPRAYAVIQNAPRNDQGDRSNETEIEPNGLVGRTSLFNKILGSFQANHGRIVTLTGAGGSGKTALAKAVVYHETEAGRRAVFLDLTSVRDEKSATAKILHELGLPGIDPAEGLTALAHHLRNTPGLYVFDNLEQLGVEAADLIRQLSKSVPGLRILATSRTPLGIDKEERIAVGPLDLPPRKGSLAEMRAADSVRLFEHHARIANPGFETTSDNVASIAELCRRLDGLPLPIILAASHTVVRSPAQIVTDIQTDLRGLTSSASNDRHSSVRAVVRWSLALLDGSFREAALRLSVFHGSFSETDAQSVLKDGSARQSLGALVEASLLNSDPNGQEAVFWFYETVRTALLQMLEEGGLSESAYDRFLDHSLAVVKARENDVTRSGWQRLRTTLADSDNILQALRSASLADGRVAELAILVQPAFSAYGLSHELMPFLQAVYSDDSGQIPVNLRARAGAAWVGSVSNVGDVHQVRAVLDHCLELAEGDVEAEALVRSKRASHYKTLQLYDLARQDLEWLTANAPEDDHDFHAWAWHSRGLVACCVNQRTESLECHLKGAERARRGEDVPLRVRILYDVGAELAHHGRYDEAVEQFQLAIALSQKLGSAKLEGLTLWQYGDALLSMGRPADAMAQIKQSVRLVYEGEYERAQKWIFLKAAEAAFKCGHAEDALRLLGKGVDVRQVENRPLADYEQTDLENMLAPLKLQVGIETYHRLWHEGTLQDWSELWAVYRELEPVASL